MNMLHYVGEVLEFFRKALKTVCNSETCTDEGFIPFKTPHMNVTAAR
jgi:hypothetical protein